MGEAPLHDLNKFRENARERGNVLCVRCKGLVDWYANKCPHCGMNYDGPASQFCAEIPEASPEKGRGCLGLCLVVLLATVAMCAAAYSFG